MNAIQIANLTKRYKDFALDNLTMTIPSGCIVGLVGQNGAGKSTTIKLIMNALPPDVGSVSVLDTCNQSAEFTATKQDIGVVLDDFHFADTLNAINVNAMMKSLYQQWDEAQFLDYLKRFSLPPKKAFKSYSRGMKMKLSLSVALSHHAKLLLLDEATSGLDPVVRDEVLTILRDFVSDEEHSVLLSSHIISDLEKICDYIAFLHQGKLRFYHEKDALLDQYAVLVVSPSQWADVPVDAVLTHHKTNYAVEALVERSKISTAFTLSKPSLEDLILFFAKEESK